MGIGRYSGSSLTALKSQFPNPKPLLRSVDKIDGRRLPGARILIRNADGPYQPISAWREKRFSV